MSFIIDYDDNSIFNYTTEIEWMHILQSKFLFAVQIT